MKQNMMTEKPWERKHAETDEEYFKELNPILTKLYKRMREEFGLCVTNWEYFDRRSKHPWQWMNGFRSGMDPFESPNNGQYGIYLRADLSRAKAFWNSNTDKITLHPSHVWDTELGEIPESYWLNFHQLGDCHNLKTCKECQDYNKTHNKTEKDYKGFENRNQVRKYFNSWKEKKK